MFLAHNVQRVALQPDSWGDLNDAITLSISKLRALRLMAYGVHLSQGLRIRGTGVRFDDVIRNSRIGRNQGGSCNSLNSHEEARLATAADDPIPDFVWSDDHVDCGAGQDNRITACADPRFIPR